MRGKCAGLISSVAALALMATGGSATAAERLHGKALYLANCSNCHGVVGHAGAAPLPSRSPAPPMAVRLAIALPYGPTLNGVLGREAGTVSGCQYSRAFLGALRGVVWTRGTLDRWITDTRAWVPGAIMVYRQPDPEVRARIIDYLEHPLPSAALPDEVPTGGGETGLPGRMRSSAISTVIAGHEGGGRRCLTTSVAQSSNE